MQDKKKMGASSTRAFPGPPGGLAASLIPPAAKKQKKDNETTRPYFFWIIPWEYKMDQSQRMDWSLTTSFFLKN